MGSTSRCLRIKGTHAYEAALFDGTADVIMEHLEYLYEKAASGEKVSFLCAPSKGGNLELVVQPRVNRAAEPQGRMSCRPSLGPAARDRAVAADGWARPRRKHRVRRRPS